MSSLGRAAAEACFSAIWASVPATLLLANPLLVLVLSMVYSAYAERLARDRLMIATVLLPVPFIVMLRLVILLHLPWVYFLLYAFVLAYGALLMLSWSIYLATHYDIQEAKRLLPFIASGLLLGAIVGGMVVVGSVALLGPANMLWLWVATLGAGALLVRRIGRRYPFLEAPKAKQGSGKPSLLRTIAEGFRYVRASALFMTMALTTFTTMIALQLMDFEYSTIFRAAFPSRAALTIPRHGRWADDRNRPRAAMVRRALEFAPFRRAGHQYGVSVCVISGFYRPCQHISAPIHHLADRHICRFTRMNSPDPARHAMRPYVNAAPRKTGGLVQGFDGHSAAHRSVSAPCCCCS